MRFLIFLMAFCVISITAEARPVSYPGGWTVMQMNDGDSNSLHLHYSPTASYSVGYKLDHRRSLDATIHAVQFNALLKRWNKPDSQANLYFKTGAGVADTSDGAKAAAFGGIATDWEDRRFFIGYENRAQTIEDLDTSFSHKARVGVAPYIGEYGDWHTWLMLDTIHDPEGDQHFRVAPLVRVFKGANLIEAGMDSEGAVQFNYVRRF